MHDDNAYRINFHIIALTALMHRIDFPFTRLFLISAPALKGRNMMPNTIPAGGEAMPQSEDESELDGLRGLEDPISSLCCMANIMADLLDVSMNGINAKYRGGQVTVIMTRHEMDLISFAWNDVVSRSESLKKAFYGVIRGSGDQ